MRCLPLQSDNAAAPQAQGGALSVRVLSSGPATAAILVEGLRAGCRPAAGGGAIRTPLSAFCS